MLRPGRRPAPAHTLRTSRARFVLGALLAAPAVALAAPAPAQQAPVVPLAPPASAQPAAVSPAAPASPAAQPAATAPAIPVQRGAARTTPFDTQLDREDDAYEARARATHARTTRRFRPRFVFATHAILLTLPGDSPFDTVARRWGYDGFHTAGRYALDLGCQIIPYVTLGARTAYAISSGGRSPVDQAELRLSMFDVSALARVGYASRDDNDRLHVFVGAEFEGGMLVATTSLRNAVHTVPLPRLAAHAMFGVYSRYFGASVRVGYHRAVWPDAAGNAGTDLVLDGFSGGVALEGRI